MKNYQFKIAISLICFGLGVLSICLRSEFFAVRDIQNVYPLPSFEKQSASVDNKVEIRFQKIIANRHYRVAKFIVENRSTKSLYYESYGKNNHCSYIFDYKIGEIEQNSKPLTCISNGISKQELSPGETATYLVDVPPEIYTAGEVSIGFEFAVGEDFHEQTIWSDKVTLPRFEIEESPIEESALKSKRFTSIGGASGGYDSLTKGISSVMGYELPDGEIVSSGHSTFDSSKKAQVGLSKIISKSKRIITTIENYESPNGYLCKRIIAEFNAKGVHKSRVAIFYYRKDEKSYKSLYAPTLETAMAFEQYQESK